MRDLDQESGTPAAGTAQGTVLALLGDLMLTVRVESAARAAGLGFAGVESLLELAQRLGERAPDLVVLDLTATAFPLEQTLASLRSRGGPPPVLAFFPHVMKELGQQARAAGCTVVVPRSRFMSDLPNLLRQTAHGDLGGAIVDDADD